ncbi:MAG: hypothetical protein AAGD22_15005 [Verrucomicrobiota bacterium]
MEDFKSFEAAGRGLLICGCEGVEDDLITGEAMDVLGSFDILIETHDGDDPAMGNRVREVLARNDLVTEICV